MVRIRTLNKADRGEVRRICCDVADRGEPIENFFFDREFAADLLTSYYTDYEPESSFVAEIDGRVVAYINGCLDNRRYGLTMLFLIIPKLIVIGFIRGVFFHKRFWMVLKGMMKNWKRIFIWRKKSFHSHQGHLHIGVSKNARHKQVGHGLVNILIDYAKSQRIDEMTASVHDGNVLACRFFEHLGFIVKDRYPMVMVHGDLFKEYHSIYYVKAIV